MYTRFLLGISRSEKKRNVQIKGLNLAMDIFLSHLKYMPSQVAG